MPIVPVLAAMSSDDQAAMSFFMILAGVGCCVLLVGLVINIFICYLLAGCLKRIPPQYRQQEPGMVWLLLIPLFGIVWNFFVWPKVAASFKAYFDAQGRADVGDCGAGLALALCICAAVGVVIGLAGLAALVLMIILLVQFNGYKKQIPESGNILPPTALR